MNTIRVGSLQAAAPLGRWGGWLMGFALLVSGGGVGADEPTAPDHLTLVETLAAGAADDVVDQLAFAPQTQVHLVPETPHPANWLVERMLSRSLRDQGCRVILSRFSAPVPSAEPEAPPEPTPAEPGAEGIADAGAGRPTDGGGAPATTGREEDSGAGDEELGGTNEEEDEGAGELGDGDSGLEGEEEGVGEGEEQGDEEELTEAQRRRLERQQARQQEEEAQETETGAAGQGEAAPEPFELVLPEQGEVLLYRIVELDLSYPWVKRSWLVGPRNYGRMASVRVRASRMSEPAHSVIAVAQGDRVQIDTFPGWARPYLEGQGYPFEIRQPESKSIQRFIEPVFVGAIVSGLVYLFYENQN